MKCKPFLMLGTACFMPVCACAQDYPSGLDRILDFYLKISVGCTHEIEQCRMTICTENRKVPSTFFPVVTKLQKKLNMSGPQIGLATVFPMT